PEYLLAQMVSDNYSQFVDAASRKANFDSPSFIGLMQQVKGMGDDGIIGEGRPYFYPIQINSPGDYMTSLKGFLAKNMKLLIMPHPEEVAAGGYFMNYLTIGLNAKSQVKEQAWDFLKFMMSDQITTPPNTAGFPINKKAFAAELAQLKDDGSVPTVKEGPLKGVPVKVDNGKLDQLQSFLEGAIHPALFRSDQVAQFVTDESKAFFSGQKSAEDVARLIQNKVTTYLNE
ncbi:ABC transporter substrate-binding protein, partial [Paenibacillus sepulcri]|nr:ABC transporter substrate-binding protein [Paenibacillus sepulcri]